MLCLVATTIHCKSIVSILHHVFLHWLLWYLAFLCSTMYVTYFFIVFKMFYNCLMSSKSNEKVGSSNYVETQSDQLFHYFDTCGCLADITTFFSDVSYIGTSKRSLHRSSWRSSNLVKHPSSKHSLFEVDKFAFILHRWAKNWWCIGV